MKTSTAKNRWYNTKHRERMCVCFQEKYYKVCTKEKERSQKIDDLPVSATRRSGTSVMLSSKVNSPVTHGSTRYVSQRPLTILTQTFECVICVF